MRMKNSILFVFLVMLFLQGAVIAENNSKPNTAGKNATDTTGTTTTKKQETAPSVQKEPADTVQAKKATSAGQEKTAGETGQGQQKQDTKALQDKKTAANTPSVEQKTAAGRESGGTKETGVTGENTATDEVPQPKIPEQGQSKDSVDMVEPSHHRQPANPPVSSVQPPPVQQPLPGNSSASGTAFPEMGFIIIAAVFLLLFIILIVAMLVGNYTTSKVLKELESLRARLLTLETQVKDMQQPRYSKPEGTSFRTGSAGTILDGGSVTSARPQQKTVRQAAAPTEPPPDTISPLYSAPAERAKRRDEAPGDIFLDISQTVFTRVQRGERLSLSSVLLEEEGTWRNSQFVLIGQQLYFNFYFYNESKELSADSPQIERVLAEMYTIQGTLPGAIQRCVPAKVIRNKTGYTVADKGLVVIG